ncbi:hypothetical protein PPL_02298 [Heterostelium album PN500]|uniref:FNIP repeat-containing protein n=1 Tax=Heterostelium pallidum (strain ATCC 26659 / Pp 5 / PN500) TaxID=670386 RepID=D3B1X3_HETP5|nr:hypothetical protein PPL_02298 [Heterostelium album PN500]EFA85297.1 hypothetical protein PPL_02298 [Heterostelium album PN500]|eukprot:XP_020437406.1 hypothetical protein PPL_02298 [Heterostelium album PN500]
MKIAYLWLAILIDTLSIRNINNVKPNSYIKQIKKSYQYKSNVELYYGYFQCKPVEAYHSQSISDLCDQSNNKKIYDNVNHLYIHQARTDFIYNECFVKNLVSITITANFCEINMSSLPTTLRSITINGNVTLVIDVELPNLEVLHHQLIELDDTNISLLPATLHSISIESRHLKYFNYSKVTTLKSTIKSMILNQSYGSKLQPSDFPPTLTNLTVTTIYPLSRIGFPTSLKSLSIIEVPLHSENDQSFDNVAVLPPNLEVLDLTYLIFGNPGALPQGLKKLYTGGVFNLKVESLPDSLEFMSLSDGSILPFGSIPPSVKHISMSKDYYKLDQLKSIPTTVSGITVGNLQLRRIDNNQNYLIVDSNDSSRISIQNILEIPTFIEKQFKVEIANDPPSP